MNSTPDAPSPQAIALSAIPSLALPPELREPERALPASPADDAWDAAEWSVVRRCAQALATLARPLAILALRAEPAGRVTVLDLGESSPRVVAVDDNASLSPLCEGGPHLVRLDSPAPTSPALLDLFKNRLPAPKGRITDAVVVSVASAPDGSLALALAFASGHPELGALLPAISAVAAACAAGCRAIRLRQRVEDDLRARDAFISFAAHELRGPVTSTKGYAQLLARQARKNPLPDAMRQSIRAIEEQSGRMGDMVGELLDASRIRRGALDVVSQKIDAAPLIKKLVERTAARNEQYTFELEARAPSLVGMWDPQRVEQIVRDLLDNAMRFSVDSARIKVTLEARAGMAEITVRDEGVGIAPDERERVFDYQYRSPSAVRRNIGGLGLGLYVSRFLAERMHGELALVESSDSAPTGSAFRLSLPLADA